MGTQERAQADDLAVGGRVGVSADRPESGCFGDWAPKLLWNPGNTAPEKRTSRESIRKKRNAFGAQSGEGAPIETVTRRDEDSRAEAVSAKCAQAVCDPCALDVGGDAGKFRQRMETEHAAAAEDTQMTVSMKTDGSAR